LTETVKKPKVIAIMGPTAAGKTALAIEVVRKFAVQIISVDSAQVYRGLDLGSAKPSADELRLAPHRLIDIRDPWQPYSVAEFVVDAKTAIEDIIGQAQTPLLVGGTMLYFRGLLRGLSELPQGDPSLRARIEAQAKAEGWPILHQLLAQLDPQSAERIAANDAQRIQRALEVFELTGRPISALQAERQGQGLDAQVLKIIISPADRSVLHQRIEERFSSMLKQGLIDEVAALREDPRVDPDSPALRAVGYRQVWQHLDGEFDRDELLQRGIFATRQLAKRQLTWLRKESESAWLDPTREDWVDQGLVQIGHFLSESMC